MDASLIAIGLTPFFTQQLTEEEAEFGRLARIIEVQRSGVVASDGIREWTITLSGAWYQQPAEQRPTVGRSATHHVACRATAPRPAIWENHAPLLNA